MLKCFITLWKGGENMCQKAGTAKKGSGAGSKQVKKSARKNKK